MKKIVYFILALCLVQLNSCGIFKKKSKSDSTKTSRTGTSKKQLLEKYSKIIGEEVDNQELYSFIDEWYGVPYKYAGKTKGGIDCSNFSCELLRKVYGFPSTFYQPSSKLPELGKKVSKSDMREGDIVCFSINQNSKISHVGIYLANNKFVHASTSSGVMINSLTEDYYKKRFAFAVRPTR